MAWYRPWEEVERVYKKVVREVSRPEFYYTAAGAVIGGGVGAAAGAYIGVQGTKMMKAMMAYPPMPPMSPSPTLGPAPTSVMASERAMTAERLKKKRRRSVMGGDYGELSVQTEKLGT